MGRMSEALERLGDRSVCGKLVLTIGA